MKGKLVSVLCLILAALAFAKPKSNLNERCVTDDDCEELNFCNKGKCAHKGIFPITFLEQISFVLIIVASALSNAGGIGGGGLLIPLLIFVLNFTTHEAIPISKVMIFSGAVISFILHLYQTNPLRKGVIIDYNLTLVIVPFLLFGTMVGVNMNRVLPPFIILMLLTLVLTVSSYTTLMKGLEHYRKENEKKLLSHEERVEVKKKIREDKINRLRKAGSRDEDIDKESDLQVSHAYLSNDQLTDLDEDLKIKRQTLFLEEQKDTHIFPLKKMFLLFLCFIVMLLVSLLKGNEHISSIIGVKRCSTAYWGIYFAYIPFAFLMTYLGEKIIKEEYQYRLAIGYQFTHYDIVWSKNRYFMFPFVAFLSGVLAGLVGIGGGLILGPLLLELGMHPIISTATSNFLVLFTSSSTSIQFILFGMLNYEFGLACAVTSGIGSYIGTILIHRTLEKLNRPSVLVFVLFAVLIVSTVLIPGNTLFQILEEIKDGKNVWDFESPC